MSRWKLVFSLLVVGLVAASGTSWASDVSEFDLVQIRTLEPSLEIVAVSPRIINHGDVDTTVIREATSGLHVVGVGEQVFLTANPGISTSMEPVLDVTATVWSLVGPTGSTATLTEAPEIDGREIQLLEPDMVVRMVQIAVFGIVDCHQFLEVVFGDHWIGTLAAML